MKKLLILFGITLLFSADFAFAQKRIAVLPFRNMDGNMALNQWCVRLSDSVATGLRQADSLHQFYTVVPQDSVAEVLASLNLDPMNPQYESDLWKAIAMLNVERAITGNFNIQYGKMLINAYNYDVQSKLPHPTSQAKNLFRTQDKTLEAVPVILNKLLPGLTQ
jgi:TolB-like protein